MRKVEDRLRDILEANDKISLFIAGGEQEYLSDILRQSAVMHELEVIGEAAANVPQQVRDLSPEVPWSRFVWLRNKLIHAYFTSRQEAVYAAAQRATRSKEAIHSVLRFLTDEP